MNNNYQPNGYGQQPYQGQQPPYQGQQPYQQQPYQQQGYPQQIIINQQPARKNGLGTAGFVLAILALVFCWVPFLDFIFWILGAVFSVIGLFKARAGWR